MEEELAALNVLHHKVELVFRLESVGQLHDERGLELFKNAPFCHGMRTLVVRDDKLLPQDFHCVKLVLLPCHIALLLNKEDLSKGS